MYTCSLITLAYELCINFEECILINYVIRVCVRIRVMGCTCIIGFVYEYVYICFVSEYGCRF